MGLHSAEVNVLDRQWTGWCSNPRNGMKSVSDVCFTSTPANVATYNDYTDHKLLVGRWDGDENDCSSAFNCNASLRDCSSSFIPDLPHSFSCLFNCWGFCLPDAFLFLAGSKHVRQKKTSVLMDKTGNTGSGKAAAEKHYSEESASQKWKTWSAWKKISVCLRVNGKTFGVIVGNRIVWPKCP